MIKRTFLIFSFYIIFQSNAFAQMYSMDSLRVNMSEVQQFLFIQQHDTSYIANYNDMLALRFVMNTKLNFFQLQDKASEQSALFRPNRGLNLGIGASYRWFALDLVFNTKIWEDTDMEDSRFLDFQGRIYTNKHFLELKLQYYDGYKIDRVNKLSYNDDAQSVRQDIRSLNMGMQYLFAFNYKKFSFKAPFVLSEVQRRSAGSFIAGLGFNVFVINGDSSIMPSDQFQDINQSLMYNDMMVLDMSIKAGYMYTYVLHENYFFSLGAIPGIGFSVGDYRIGDRQRLTPQITWNMKGLGTLGYNDDRMFYGIQCILDLNSVNQDYKARTLIGTGKISLMYGYRFNVK